MFWVPANGSLSPSLSKARGLDIYIGYDVSGRFKALAAFATPFLGVEDMRLDR